MSERNWSYKVLIRYILIQSPGLLFLICILLLVRRWVVFPAWIIWMAGIISAAVDVLLFFFTWSAYDWDTKESPVGETGVAIDRIDPVGYVRVHGEQWKAERMGNGPPIEKGRKVMVCGREGLVLYILPAEEK